MNLENLFDDRSDYLLMKYGLEPDDFCVYVMQDNDKYYVGSTSNLKQRYQNIEDYNKIIKVYIIGKNISSEQRRIEEQSVIDEYKAMGFTLLNMKRAKSENNYRTR